MELCVLHYHFRPGGVRRVIELGLPALADTLGLRRVTFASGEAPPQDWRAQMEKALHPCAVDWFVEPALGYWSEQKQTPAVVQAAIREALRHIIKPTAPLWAHNLSVGRNMLLTREVAALAASAPLWLHHHDWWWDGRWERWPEMQSQGFSSLAEALAVTLPHGPYICHYCVNRADADWLSDWTGGTFRFLPNPLERPAVTPEETEAARAWLRRETGADHWWLYPCRGLRRKNIAESLLVQQTRAPHAVTVTTGAASSAEEAGCFRRLTSTAARHGWPLFAGVAAQKDTPSVPAFQAAVEMVVVTSLREGFGLPFCEAALANRPCCGRIPFGLTETMDHTGAPLAEQWHQFPVPRDSFDEGREAAHAAAGRENLLTLLPAELHATARAFSAPRDRHTVDFGTLSLDGQLEVLTSLHGGTAAGGHTLSASPPLRSFYYPWSPGQWALQFLLPDPSRSWHPAWDQNAAPVIGPSLHHWMGHPLLWPDS